MEAFVVEPADRVPIGRQGLETVVGGDRTQSSFALMHGTLPPRTAGPVLHIHRSHDEAFLVLEGTLTVVVEGKDLELGPGTFAWAPRGLPHSFVNRTDGTVRFLGISLPAGVEAMLAEMAEAARDGPPDMAVIAEIGARYDSEIAGPPPAV